MKIAYCLLIASSIIFASQSPQEIPVIGKKTLEEMEQNKCEECAQHHSQEWWAAVAKDYMVQARHAVEMHEIRFTEQGKTKEKASGK